MGGCIKISDQTIVWVCVHSVANYEHFKFQIGNFFGNSSTLQNQAFELGTLVLRDSKSYFAKVKDSTEHLNYVDLKKKNMFWCKNDISLKK